MKSNYDYNTKAIETQARKQDTKKEKIRRPNVHCDLDVVLISPQE